QSHIEPIAAGVSLLLEAQHNNQALPLQQVRDILTSHVAPSVLDDLQQLSQEPDKVDAFILRLLDQYGTGRIMFRNTRQSVSGFPERTLKHIKLSMPDSYQAGDDVIAHLSLELSFQVSDEHARWTAVDPRIPWLVDTLASLDREKVVLIAHHAESIRALADYLREKYGIHAALFHEGMSLIERDQAAAWFADFEQGTNLLLCSEIGSEGRNFQFARHLVLFDLPPHPDLLEQRIGRLDRIGQGREILLHVPVFENSRQHIWFRWYHEGLGIFTGPNPAAAILFNLFKSALSKSKTPQQTNQLIQETKLKCQQLLASLARGRDRLLEYQSHPPAAKKLVEQAEATENVDELIDFMHRVYDLYGVDYEINTNGSEILKPTEQMLGYFPRLPDEGMTVTYHRRYALANETWHYLTWEHPMIGEVMDMIMNQEKGNSTLVVIQQQGLKAGQLFLECHYQFALSGRQNRYLAGILPPQNVRLLLTEQGKDLSEKLNADSLQTMAQSVPQKTAIAVLKAKLPVIKQLLKLADFKIKQQQPELIKQWQNRITDTLQAEIARLKQLAVHNRLVRDDEMIQAQHQLDVAIERVGALQPQLESLRILVTM
ncbi:MAG: RNA polymerase-associated protein RapA, partial [Proteobacteria bacterium]